MPHCRYRCVLCNVEFGHQEVAECVTLHCRLCEGACAEVVGVEPEPVATMSNRVRWALERRAARRRLPPSRPDVTESEMTAAPSDGSALPPRGSVEESLQREAEKEAVKNMTDLEYIVWWDNLKANGDPRRRTFCIPPPDESAPWQTPPDQPRTTPAEPLVNELQANKKRQHHEPGRGCKTSWSPYGGYQ